MAVLEEIESDASLQGPVVSSESSPVTSSVRHRGRPVVPDDPDGTSSLDEWSLQDSDSDLDRVEDDEGGLEPNATDLYEDLQDGRLSERAELLFDLALWCIPFGFIFELLNLLAQKQYHQESTFAGEVATLAQRLPPLVLLIWWNLRERRKWLTQAVMFVIGTLAGCYLAYVVNKVRLAAHARASYDISLARTPALGTLWIFAIVRLDLGYATASVLLFGAYVYAAGLKLVL
ncbi:Uncharacterized protein MSYG_3630 [Malassezia sympodialis ATCC 42132]|uniref:DUF7719 domain-containing protein n=1 Tax=Malassezia sympodialis (strain ATCC 42132) TaxID=1230383 RepID=A0A1M8AA02_MALS4|nr:Uncharacterized protein MSYG_3630 [Malassezia sympodialis ATCC 42132]